jgi:hypothetical protein
VDEITIDVATVLLGGGVGLFDHLGSEPIKLERKGASIMDWFNGYIESINEYLGDVAAESEDFREAVKSNIEQFPVEQALVLQGLSTISMQIEALMNLLIGSMGGQAQHTGSILEQLRKGRRVTGDG